MFIGTTKVKGRAYVRILESKRIDGMPRPQVIANLGNLETFRDSIPTIVRGLHRLLGQELADDALELENLEHAEWGVTLVVHALWEELRLGAKLRQCVRAREPFCPTEVLVRTMVTNRLSDPTSKLGIARWLEDATMGEAEDAYVRPLRAENPVRLANRFYAAMDSALRHRAALERHLYGQLKDLFHLDVDVVFYDLTSSYFEGSEAELGRLGYSRDERPGNLQIVVGLVLVDGFPVSHHVFKGHRRDATCLVAALERIRRRFSIRQVIVVGDRGLVTEDNLTRLRKDFQFILACRRRHDRHTRQALRARPPVARFTDAAAARGQEPPPPVVWSLEGAGGDRLVGLTNPVVAREDAQRRAEILDRFRAELDELKQRFRRTTRGSREKRLQQVTELLVRRRKLGKRYFTTTLDAEGQLTYRTKPRVLAYEERIDGTTILKTNNRTLTDAEVIARYKELARIERAFRDLKNVIDLRPIYHRAAGRIAAHVFVCVLALLLERMLARKLEAAGVTDMTAEAALEAVKRVRLLRDSVNGVEIQRVSRLRAPEQRILRAVGACPPSPLVSVRIRKRGKRRKSR